MISLIKFTGWSQDFSSSKTSTRAGWKKDFISSTGVKRGMGMRGLGYSLLLPYSIVVLRCCPNPTFQSQCSNKLYLI